MPLLAYFMALEQRKRAIIVTTKKPEMSVKNGSEY